MTDEQQTDDSLSDKTKEITINYSSQERNKVVASFKKLQLGTRKRKLDPVELKMMKFLEDPENRHMSFFKYNSITE